MSTTKRSGIILSRSPEARRSRYLDKSRPLCNKHQFCWGLGLEQCIVCSLAENSLAILNHGIAFFQNRPHQSKQGCFIRKNANHL